MGWVMLFWVFVIVAVPTVLWFLLSEKPRSSLGADDSRNVIPLRRPGRGWSGREDEEGERDAKVGNLDG